MFEPREDIEQMNPEEIIKESISRMEKMDFKKMNVAAKIAIMRHLPYLTTLAGHVRYEHVVVGNSIAFVYIGVKNDGTKDDMPTIVINPLILGYIDLVYGEEAVQPCYNFFVLHELLHLALGHFERVGERDHELFNIAADYTINNAVEQMKIPNTFFVPPFVYYGDFINLNAEKIYEELKKNSKEDKNNNSSGNGAEGEGGDGSGGDNQLPDLNKPASVEGNQFKEIDKKTGQNVKSAVRAGMSSSKKNNKGIGNSPGNMIREMIEELLKPAIDWQGILANKFREIKDDDYETYNYYHYLSGDVIFPTYVSETINLSIVIDTSGSMGYEEIRTAVSEVLGLINTAKANVALFSCDTETEFSGMFSFEEGEDPETFLTNLKLQGGGGTDMYAGVVSAHEWAEENLFRHDAIVVISDGYIDEFNNDLDEEVIFISLHNDCQELIHNATFIHFKDVIEQLEDAA